MPIDVDLLFDNHYGQQEDTYDLEPSITRQVLNTIFTPIRPILDALNYPGDTIRGLITGKGLQSFIPGEENRTSGQDVIEHFGGTPHEGILGVIESIGVELATDPLLLGVSSITGLTRAGKLAQELSRIKEGLAAGDALNALKIESKLPAALRGFGNEAFNLNRASMASRSSELTASGVKPLAATRAEQIAQGQRGVSIALPEWINEALGLERSAEYVPQTLNKVLAPVNKLIGRTGEAIVDTTIGKKIKEMFKSTADNPITQAFHDMKAGQANFALKQATKLEEKAGKALDDLTGTLYQPASDPALIKPLPDMRKAVYQAQETAGVPMRADAKWEQYSIARSERTLNSIAAAEAIRDKAVALPDITGFDHAAAQGVFQKSVQNIFKNYRRDMNTMWTKVQKVKGDALAKMGFINEIGGVPESFLNRVVGAQKDMFNALQANYVSIKNSEKWNVSYVRRLLSDEAKELIKRDPKAREIIFNAIQPAANITKGRKFENVLTDVADKVMQKKLGVKFNIFKYDPVDSFRDYWVQANDIMHNVRQTNAAIELLAKPMPIEATAEQLASKVSLGEMLKTQGLRGIDLGVKNGKMVSVEWGAGAKGDEIQRLILSTAKKNGLDYKAWNKYINADDWKFLTSQEIVKNDSLFHSIIQPINQLFKTLILAIPPASIQHVGTNMFGNQWANVNAGVGSVKYLWQAAKVMLADMAERDPQGWAAKFLPDWQTIDRSILDNFHATVGSSKNFAEEFFPAREYKRTNKIADAIHVMAGGKLPDNPNAVEKVLGSTLGKAAEFHFNVNNFVEETSKLAHFIGKVDQGSDVWTAANSVRKYLFDYNQLTPFEKKFMQPSVLFYTFARKNLPLQLQEIISNRTSYAIAKSIDATTRDEEFIPEYLKNGGNIMTGPGSFLNLRNPMFDINRFSPQGGGIQRVADQVVNQLSPALRLPIELFTGRESFRGKPLEDLNRVSPEIGELLDRFGMVDKIKTSSGMDYRLHAGVYQLLRNLPTSRIQNTLSNLISQDMYDNPAYSLLSLTGGSWKQFNPDILKTRVMQEKILAKLGETPGVRKFTDYFDVRETKDEKVKKLLAGLKTTGEQLSVIYKKQQ